MTQPSDRRERYATAIHDAMETDLSLVDQEPAYQALIARAAEAAEALADAEQNRQFLTTLANLGIATHRLDRIRDAARLHRQQLLGTSELYAVIAADDEPEQCPRSEFDGYGLQCQKPAGHNLCTFEEQPAAVSAVVEPPADQTTPSHRAALREQLAAAIHADLTSTAYRRDGGLLGIVPRLADAVLAVLYREWPWLRAEAEDAQPVDRAEWNALVREADQLRRDGTALHARAEELDKQLAALRRQVTEPADRAAVLREAADAVRDGDLGPRDGMSRDYENGWWNSRAAAEQRIRRLADADQESAPTTDQQVRAVQAWMALDLHQALGRPVDHSATVDHQGHASWADWWADLLAGVRNAQMIRDYRAPLRRMADETATTETQPECTASRSGTCLREAESETACDSDAGECVHGGQPAAGARQDGEA